MNPPKKLLAISLLLLSTSSIAGTSSPDGATTYIISPSNGATVTSPVTVIFGLQGMGVAPAGTDKENTGHHHLIIDAATPDLHSAIPKDENHKHFGGGQTQVTLDLPPGEHSLQLVLGDKAHMPHNPPVVSETIKIMVK